MVWLRVVVLTPFWGVAVLGVLLCDDLPEVERAVEADGADAGYAPTPGENVMTVR